MTYPVRTLPYLAADPKSLEPLMYKASIRVTLRPSIPVSYTHLTLPTKRIV